jgi:ferric-dicitrate binding protein FerR (iron transport regulator)
MQINWELIEKYLANQCSPQEQEAVRIFLQGQESEKLLKEILEGNSVRDWSLFEKDTVIHPKNEEWKSSIHEKIGYSPEKKDRPIFRRFFSLRNAAIWIGIILATTFYAIQHSRINTGAQAELLKAENPYGQRSRIFLSDSSIVYLGAGSKLMFPEAFIGKSREIYLDGEAFFEISRNPQMPFIVHTGKVQTKVLGTSFKIEAFPGAPFAVEVATGKIQIAEKNTSGLKSLAILTPGEQLTYYDGKISQHQVLPEDVMAWKNSLLTFNNKSLYEITRILERWYDVRISFKNKMKAEEKLTLSINATTSVDKIFKVLASAAHFNYNITKKEIVIH